MSVASPSPKRVLIVLPSWVGDAVMATPALRAIRTRLPGAFIGALAKPGIDEVLAGTDFFDEVHVDARAGMMGVKRAASKVRMRRYGAAALLTNSFSTALVTRVAGIPERIGFDRDGRGLLLTTGLRSLRRSEVAPYSESGTNPRAWAPIPACEHYMAVARALTGVDDLAMGPLELATTAQEENDASALLSGAGIGEGDRFVVLNPGGNNPAKRWPEDRFVEVGAWLRDSHGLGVLVNGSPGERELAQRIVDGVGDGAASLPALGMRLATLKAIIRCASLMITNDTGPRHIAAAFGVPVVSLFGPTDHRWTTIPFDQEAVLVADPTLPACEVANDHPERCAVAHIAVETVRDAAEAMLAGRRYVQAASERSSTDSETSA